MCKLPFCLHFFQDRKAKCFYTCSKLFLLVPSHSTVWHMCTLGRTIIYTYSHDDPTVLGAQQQLFLILSFVFRRYVFPNLPRKEDKSFSSILLPSISVGLTETVLPFLALVLFLVSKTMQEEHYDDEDDSTFFVKETRVQYSQKNSEIYLRG